MTRIVSPPPPVGVMLDELTIDPLNFCMWLVQHWSDVVALEDEVRQLRAHVADLQGEVGI